MRFSAGTRLGRYEIVALLGVGGMGEVYRATDSRLKRPVAIKVLSAEAAADAELCARVKREAQTVAALKHPNVCVLYDVADLDGAECLVMEYIEGETLAARLRGGPLPLAETLRYASQIASALEAAHRSGIIHRDLKPANVMLAVNGAKLLDFGLAKRPLAAFGEAGDATAVPVTAHATILGTLGYSAPEQLQGRAADARSDVFAFGATVFELLTGSRAFGGESEADVVAAVMSGEPDEAELDARQVPALLKRIVLKCLAKDPAQRWQSARDLGDALQWVEAETPSAAERAPATRTRYWVGIAGAAAIAAAAGYAVSGLREPVLDLTPLHVSIVAPSGTQFTERDLTGHPQFALSPNGNRLAFVATARGEAPRLWVRALDSGAVQALQGTEQASGPFWSPDGEHLGFFASGKLKRIPVGGGPPREVADVAVDVASGAWSPTGVILFSPASGFGLVTVAADGGPTTQVTELDAGKRETTHRFPQFLPGGTRFLYYVRAGDDSVNGVYIGELGTARKTFVMQARANVVYSDSGYLLYERDGNLTSQRFDPEAGEVLGEPHSLGQRVLGLRGPSYLPVSVAANGLLAYWQGEPPPTELQWFDRGGREVGSIEMPERSEAPSLSPDGTRLLVTQRADSNQSQLWRVDLTTGVSSQLTFGVGTARFGIWSPDGENALYTTLGPVGGLIQLTQKSASGAGAESTIAGPGEHYAIFPEAWSHDGRWILYTATTAAAWDIFALDTTNGTVHSVLATRANERQADLSPNGRWLAYASDESGADEVYVQPFPEGGGSKWRISTAGGVQPLWRSDGTELFYLAADGRLMAVAINEAATLEPGATTALFETRMPPMLAPFRRGYTVTPDGERFLLNNVVPDAKTSTITLMRNWQLQ